MPKKPMITPRKPTRPADPVAAAKFLEAADAKAEPSPEPQVMAEVHELRKEPETVPAPEPKAEAMPKPKAQPEVKPVTTKAKGRRIYERKRDGRKVRQTTMYLDPALAKKLAFHCIEVEQDQSTIVNEALRLYLASEA